MQRYLIHFFTQEELDLLLRRTIFYSTEWVLKSVKQLSRFLAKEGKQAIVQLITMQDVLTMTK